MKPIPFVISLLVAGAVLAIVDLCTLPTGITDEPACAPIDTVWPYPTVLTIDADSGGSIYDSLAAELGIEPAAMRAVSSIEAGHSHTAFISPGSPVVNLEVPMFKEQLQRAGLDVDSLARAVPDAFSRPSRSAMPTRCWRNVPCTVPHRPSTTRSPCYAHTGGCTKYAAATGGCAGPNRYVISLKR